MKTLVFDMSTGVSGDMILGALFDLGMDLDAWSRGINSLKLPVSVEFTKVLKHGIQSGRALVNGPTEHIHRGLKEILPILDQGELPDWVREVSKRIFGRIAQAEAKIHGISMDEVHFHEIGALDTIVDVVGVCLGFHLLRVGAFWTNAFPFGSGTLKMAHGIVAEPAPATLALTLGFPTWRSGLKGELCTPTGAAIVSTLAKPLNGRQNFLTEKIGYGAGTKDFENAPNMIRLVLCQDEVEGKKPVLDNASAWQLECNLDDMTPELTSFVCNKILELGVYDCWQESIVMKKGRLAIKLSVLCSDTHLEEVAKLIAHETTTGGMRYFPVKRIVAEKRSVTNTENGILGKVISFPDFGIEKFKVEFESLRSNAHLSPLPLKDLAIETQADWLFPKTEKEE